MQPAPRTRRGPGAGAILLAVSLGALLGGAGGFAAGLFAFPLLQPPPEPQVVVEGDDAGPRRATGRFVQVDPRDRVHWGAGTVHLFERRLRLGDDFEVAPGPKYHLYLVPLVAIDPDTRVEESMFVDLGPLAAFAGAQEYGIPGGLGLDDYPSVVVWSEQLNQLVSVARLVEEATSAGASTVSK
jgi:hypothetical protein